MRILLFADIHIGSIKDTTYVYNVITDIIEKEIVFKKTDMVVILGDYFHRLFKVNEEYVSCAINTMSYLIRACQRSNTKIRIVYGTESHEMNQYKLFNYHFTSSKLDIKLFDTVYEEEVNGTRILYLPEEYINNKHKFYKNTIYSGKTYDYIFGHGIIEDGMPSIISIGGPKSDEKQVPRFKSGEFSEISKVTVFGHFHTHVKMKDNVYYLGSLFRDSFGEEEPKGYGIIEDDKFTFIENTEAYIFKTYEFNDQSNIYENSEDIIKEIDNIKKENENIFNGDKHGKIRIIFKTPENVNPSFKENLKTILFNDKYISPLIKETSTELLADAKDEVADEYDFILDASMAITDKIYKYISNKYDNPMSLEELTAYINESYK